MMTFLALCVSGLQDVAAYQLQQEGFEGFRLLTVEDGLVAFETKTFPNALAGLRTLNNSFQIFVRHRLEEGQTLDTFLRWIAAREEWHASLRRSVFPRERSFRLVLSEENRLVQGDRTTIGRLGAAIGHLTRLVWMPRGADVEFWALLRADGEAYFGRRLSRRARSEKDLQPGELKPELAHLLCLISEPDKADIVLDPFAGSGAIPLARSHSAYNMIFASDLDTAKADALKAKIRAAPGAKARKNGQFIARAGDALNLARFETGFIDKVITDPPWGLFDTGLGDIGEFYRRMLRELIRVTRVNGLIVLLLGDRALARELAHEYAAELTLDARYDILVSGKKAVVMKLRRKQEIFNNSLKDESSLK